MRADDIRSASLSLAAFGLLLSGWWALTVVLTVPSFVLPPPGDVGSRLLGNPDLYVIHARYTLEKVVFGGAFGILGGVVVGFLLYSVTVVRRVLLPYIVTIRVLPKIAIAPLLLIYYGAGMDTAVFLVALIAFFPMALSTEAGFERVPKRHQELLESVDADPIKTLVSVHLPYALPDIFAGLKQSITLAVVGAIIAEWILVNNGLGHLILVGSQNLQTDMMIASLAVLVVLGLSLYAAIALVQRRLPWAAGDSSLET